MTFDQIVTEVKDRLNLTSSDSTTRIGRLVNDRYKRVTSALGIVAPRRTTVQATATVGVSTLVFTGLEKILNIQDRTGGSYTLLEEVSVDEIRETQEVNDSNPPTKYAVLNTTSTTVTILMNCVPQDDFTLYADGLANASTLSGSNEPAFPESFHDLLVYGALADEYRKLMRMEFVRDAEQMYESRLAQLRMHFAASGYRDIYQGKRGAVSRGTQASGGGSAGASLSASSSWTQTGLITFNRGSGNAPFAVAAGQTVVANLIAESVEGGSVDATTGDFSGAVNIDGAVDLDSTLDVAGVTTLRANLLFSADNSHDIGATGATRPRDLHLGRNALIGGTLGVTGVATFTAQSVHSAGVSLSANGQIAFPAAQNPSSDANTLDDYEEGNWTPVLGGEGGTSGQTYSVQLGRYVKIGRFVHCTAHLALTAKGTITGNLQVQGLPFVAHNLVNSYGGVHVPYWNSMASSIVHMGGIVIPNTTSAYMYVVTAAAASVTIGSTADIGNTTALILHMSYRTEN